MQGSIPCSRVKVIALVMLCISAQHTTVATRARARCNSVTVVYGYTVQKVQDAIKLFEFIPRSNGNSPVSEQRNGNVLDCHGSG